MKWGAELPAVTSRQRHICNPRRVCAKRSFRHKNFTFWSYKLQWQQYTTWWVLGKVQPPFLRPVRSDSMFSFRLSGLWLVTWHATCFAIIDLAPPIVALHHGKTAGSANEQKQNTKRRVTYRSLDQHPKRLVFNARGDAEQKHTCWTAACIVKNSNKNHAHESN